MFDSSEGQMAKEAESRCPEYRWPCIARDAIYIPTGATPWGYWKSIVRWEKAMSANVYEKSVYEKSIQSPFNQAVRHKCIMSSVWSTRLVKAWNGKSMPLDWLGGTPWRLPSVYSNGWASPTGTINPTWGYSELISQVSQVNISR